MTRELGNEEEAYRQWLYLNRHSDSVTNFVITHTPDMKDKRR